MLSLRYPKLWLGLGWLLVLGVMAGTLLPSTGMTINVYDKYLHAGSYGLLMVWFSGLYSRRRYLPIALILIVLGAVLDGLQAGTATRQFDILDVGANVLGVGAGLLLALGPLGGWCQRVEALFPE